MTFEYLKSPVADLLRSEDVQKKIVQQVIDSLDKGCSGREEKERRWLRCLQAYNQYINKKRYKHLPWRSKLPVGWSYEAVESGVVELSGLMFPEDERFFSIEPAIQGLKAQERNGVIMTRHIQRQYDQMDFIEIAELWLKQLCIIGNAPLKIYWKREEREMPTESFAEDTGIRSIFKQVVPVYDAPFVELLDMKDFIVYPASGRHIDRCLVIHRLYKPIDEIKSNPIYRNTAKLSKEDVVDANPEKDLYRKEVDLSFGIDSEYETTEGVELLEAWGDFVIEGKRYRNYVATVAGRKHLIRFQANPYDQGVKPFVFTGLRPVPHQNYAMGLIEPALYLHSMGSTITNMMLDELKLALHGQWKYEPDGIFNPAEFILKPGGVHAVGSIDNLQPLVTNSNFGIGFDQLNTIKAEYEEITGVTKYSKGAESVTKNRTAREAVLLAQSSDKGFTHIARHLNRTGLKPAVKLTYLLNRQFEDPAKIAEYTGAQPEEIDLGIPLDIMQVRITGLETALQAETAIENIERAITGIERTRGAEITNWQELLTRYFKALNFHDPEKLLLPENIIELIRNSHTAQALGLPPESLAVAMQQIDEEGAQLEAAEAPSQALGISPYALSEDIVEPNEGGL